MADGEQMADGSGLSAVTSVQPSAISLQAAETQPEVKTENLKVKSSANLARFHRLKF
jgi:hypothetical protein